MIISPITKTNNVKFLFQQKEVPVFQNKVYNNQEQAMDCVKATVQLYQCLDSGFVFSGGFDLSLLEYDENYQNEQGNSTFFKQHLQHVYSLMKDRNLLDGTIVEIGCGKGLFLNILLNEGHQAIGIDPTYEGDSEYVIKEYYSEKHKDLKANHIVLRHTLEHIAEPLDFLHMIAKANEEDTVIYIEIPTFEWIYQNNAVEDVFYEHCNYFTKNSIETFFTSCEVIPLFNGQYMGIFARLGDLRQSSDIRNEKTEEYIDLFANALENYESLFSGNGKKVIWGAGAKGSTLLNLLDKDRSKIVGVIDINPKKQNKYIGGTGHPIYSPEVLLTQDISEIIVANSNYISEIDKIVKNMGLSITLKTL